MASYIGIQAGALSSVNNYSNDVKVRDTLLKYGMARGLWNEESTLTNQQKLDAVVDDIALRVVAVARNYELDQRRADLVDDVQAEIGLE
jgi:hypothetical protein